MSERREQERLQVYKVVGIYSGEQVDKVGITRNVSPTGCFFHSASRFKVGDSLQLLMELPGSDAEETIAARVVRTELDDENTDSNFPHLTAVEFDEPIEMAADEE